MAVKLSCASCSNDENLSEELLNVAAEGWVIGAVAAGRTVQQVRLYNFESETGDDWALAVNIARWIKREGQAE